MKVLAIDTSNYVMGIALIEEGKVLGEYITNLQKNHSVRVMPCIEALLNECSVKPTELDKIVVAKGPGSYTGVRIGVTIAKTLAWTLKIPLAGVSSLETLAANGRFFNGLISPLFDARRGQVYTGLYEFRDGVLRSVREDQNILLSDWAQSLKDLAKPVLFLGNDVPIHQDTVNDILGDASVFGSISMYNPRPSELAFLGLSKPDEDIHTFVPNYIRLAEAESKWLEQQNNSL
ncbi:tRNA (adenosine(37)-N6)-threonylcarbamoyltransferase complex dimerization subunit type 1 TsaB [Peribacillus deserti]|uniref:tRNA (Adenosine(37)-N6)-threonylcarbamoyltransferase complex dimerization subunit type 1 TsaB n=1 Tax=Peribacillus deserti TaxID=673318 RepID=A0A2N5MAP6_9BACI|nr:tRNA (adenosine(37)-N6)-threonylcarbamoyltransferase complex dimerization subunit type 1 TsaB [Peribacillus deserti]PLT31431.1 tRNA (adenosine(37)-N6)-threonylcarbamoyltransferase complex dimerization subunit type 1 TsaB [Peribacillus deserti]